MIIEPLLRDAAIKGIDALSARLSDVEKEAEGAISKLLKAWNDLDQAEKEKAIEVAIAIATTAVGLIAAWKSPKKKVRKKARRKAAKKLGKTLGLKQNKKKG